MLSGVHLVIDGRSIPMEPDWSATEGPGGYDRFSCHVPLEHIRRFSLGQESQAVLYDDSANIIWYGTLPRDPAVQGDIAAIEAEGPQAEAERDAGRLLYQTRDVSMWTRGADPPHDFVETNDAAMESETRPTSLFFRTRRNEVLALGDFSRLAVWAPGTPGGLTRLAFSKRTNYSGPNLVWRTGRFTGPTGTVTNIGADIPAAAEDVDRVMTGAEDGLLLTFRSQANFTVASTNLIRFVNTRVNGIWGNTGRAANRDIMYVDEGIADAFSRLGWGTSNLTQRDTNVLPLDWQDGAFADLLDYLTLLVDYVWMAPLEPGGNGIFREWGNTEWRVQKSRGANVELEKLRLYNRVLVPYIEISEAPRKAIATPTTDPLPGTTRTFVAEELADPQHNADLANSVAQTLANRLARDRWTGRIDIVEARDPVGYSNPYLIRFGDHVIEQDAGPGESRTHRVMSVEKREDGVSVGIEGDVSVGGLLGLDTLRKQRKMLRAKGPTRKQRRRRQEQLRKARKRHRKARKEFIESLPGHLKKHKRRKRIERWRRKHPRPG